MNELAKALVGSSAFAPAKTILQAIPETTALERPGLAPHSIYAEVWHMDFWQTISLNWIEGRPTAYPKHASEGFPQNLEDGSGDSWKTVLDRFLEGVQYAAAVANDTARLDTVVACPRIHEPDRIMTIRDQLESLAAHNAYHLGRIVLLRQMLDSWPPPGGGETW